MTDSRHTSFRWALLVGVGALSALLLSGPVFGASGAPTPDPTGNIGFTVTTPSPSPSMTPSASPTPAASPSLPNTGGPDLGWVAVGLGLAGVGCVVVLASRRRVSDH